MSRRLYPHNRVRYWYAYDVEEISALFADLTLHPQTIRTWIKSGLKTIDSGKPALIYGNELIIFLKENNQSNKYKTEFHKFYCMGCQDARPVFQNRISIQQKTLFLKAQGLCRVCKNKMFKNYKLSDFTALRKRFRLVDVSELYDDASPTGKTHIEAQHSSHTNESLQGELF